MSMEDNVGRENVILEMTSSTILWIEERPNTKIVVGAPHHAPGGIKHLPCPEHEDSDENTGLIAQMLAEEGNLCSVIACNYRIDPNKNLKTDYSRQIITWKPKYLVEIHGHGAKRVPDTVIEISSGSAKRNTWSIKFSECLQNKFSSNKHLKKYKVDGDFQRIHFKALKSETITYSEWISFHIELPPSLRIDSGNKLPPYASDLVLALSQTLAEICI
jgi:hypothetical protein